MTLRAKNIKDRAVSSAKLGTDVFGKKDYTFCNFKSDPLAVARAGGVPGGETGSRNLLFLEGAVFEYHIKGTQTIIVPVKTTTGLDIGMDQTSADGIEITQGILEGTKHSFKVGTDEGPVKLRVKAKIADVSGANPFVIGWRKAEAYQADEDDYDELASMGIHGTAGDVKTEKILNNAATVVTDTTKDWADGETHTMEVRVDGAGQVTCHWDGGEKLTHVSEGKVMDFDNAEIIVPFLYFLNDADLAGAVEIIEWECGRVNE